MKTKTLSFEEQAALIGLLEDRFHQNKQRHPEIKWETVLERLHAHPKKLSILLAMEKSGGEPDVIGHDKNSREVTFCDCAAESPKERRSLCYDQQALDSRKEHKPAGSAIEMAKEIGIELLNEQQYRDLQTLGQFDTKTSSWIQTPEPIRKLKGALFCDRRYNTVFTYHNGAESYYAARGFRGQVKI